MKTGIPEDLFSSIPQEDLLNLDENLDCFTILKTPVKRKNRFHELDSQGYRSCLAGKSAYSDQKSAKSSVSFDLVSESRGRDSGLKMSPFSKYLAKLSPLISKDQLSYKLQKLGSCSKFSVENIKSPEGEKIKFNIEDIMNANDTPTFNSHRLDSVN